MKKYLYVVHDEVAQESGPIFEAKNDGVAIRNYQHIISQTKSPDEFKLVKIGIIEHETNIIEAIAPYGITVNLNVEADNE